MTLSFVLLLRNPQQVRAVVIVSLDPMSGGSLSSTCLHVPCDGELTTHTQASLALLGSWMSTRQGPGAVKSWNAMSWLWPRRPWFLLLQVGTEKLPLSPARAQSWENTFLPVGLVWTSLGAGGPGR